MISPQRNPEGGIHDLPPPDSDFTSDRAGSNSQHTSETSRTGLRFLSLSEILERPPIEWIIEGVLPKDAIGVLYGGPGLGKSFIAIEWSMCVATGKDWCGRRVSLGVVVYIAAEGTRGLGQRLRAWAGPRLDDANDELFKRFLALSEEVNFRDERSVNALLVEIGRMPVKPDLIVVDTAARCMVGGDENSAQHMGEFVQSCDRLRKFTRGSVLLVHHATKKGDSERGSSALRGAVDTMMEVSTVDGVRTLRCDKQKDADEFAPLCFSLAPVQVGEREDGRPITSCTVKWVPAPPDPVDLEKGPGRKDANAGICRTLREQFAQGATGPEILKATGLPKQTFYDHLKKLIADGTVERIPDSKPDRYRLTRGQSESESGQVRDSGPESVQQSESESAAPVGGGTRTGTGTQANPGTSRYGDERDRDGCIHGA